jgi:hypothetical protein
MITILIANMVEDELEDYAKLKNAQEKAHMRSKGYETETRRKPVIAKYDYDDKYNDRREDRYDDDYDDNYDDYDDYDYVPVRFTICNFLLDRLNQLMIGEDQENLESLYMHQ